MRKFVPFSLLVAAPLLAQRDPHAAQPERPTVATHAGTVSPGWLEIESGIELDHGADGGHAALGLVVAKLGVGSRLQLSLYGAAVRPGDNTGGVGDFTAGLKWRLAEKHALLGDFAILPSVKVPTGSVARGSGTGTTDGSLLLISSRDAGPVHIDLNAGYTFRDGSGERAPRQAGVWTASFSGAIAGALQWTAEVFGYPGTGGAQGAAPIVPVVGAQPHAFYAGVVYNIGRVWGSDRK